MVETHGGDDRVAEDRGVGAIRNLGQVILLLEPELVVEHADGAGKVAAGAEAEHGDLVRDDAPGLGVGTDQPQPAAHLQHKRTQRSRSYPSQTQDFA